MTIPEPDTIPHPDLAVSTWDTACRCGLRCCRSGWPAGAPLPAGLPDPVRFLDEQRRASARHQPMGGAA